MDNKDKWPDASPWQPTRSAIDLKHLGKLNEELGELVAAVSRCIIQGIDECHPVTRKSNREWLENEIADVYAGIELAIGHFKLDRWEIGARMNRKMIHLAGWHNALAEDGQ